MKKKTPIKQNKNFLIIFLSTFLILLLIFINFINDNDQVYTHSYVEKSCGQYSDVDFMIYVSKQFKLKREYKKSHTEYLFTRGKEYVELLCGDGFGGGCEEENVSKFTINNNEVDSCYIDGIQYFQSYIGAGKTGATLSIQSNIEDENELRQILSTLKVIK